MKKEISGAYAIINEKTGRRYIGSSKHANRYQNQSNYNKRTGGQKNVERIIGGTKKGSKKTRYGDGGQGDCPTPEGDEGSHTRNWTGREFICN